jgi:hypothetical protein
MQTILGGTWSLSTMRYLSGEEIMKGDRVLIGGASGVIELLVSDPNDPEQAWYLKTCGPGVMISEPTTYGFLFTDRFDEDLEFVDRA